MFRTGEISGAAEDHESPTKQAATRVLKIWTLMNEIGGTLLQQMCAHTSQP